MNHDDNGDLIWELQDYRDLIQRLRDLEKISLVEDKDIIADAQLAIENLIEHFERAQAAIDDKISETRLVKFGPGEAGWEMELKEGIIPFIAQYMIEVMNMDKEKPLNFVSIDVKHHEHGSLELILQRKDGKRPAEMVTELKEQLAEAENRVAWYEWWLRGTDMMSGFQDAHSYHGGDFSVAPPSDDET